MSSLKEALKTIGIIIGVIATITTTFYLCFFAFLIISYIALFSPLIILGVIPYAIYRRIRGKRRKRKNEKSSSRSIRRI
jgi:CHASE2 domain-containing sensor protein